MPQWKLWLVCMCVANQASNQYRRTDVERRYTRVWPAKSIWKWSRNVNRRSAGQLARTVDAEIAVVVDITEAIRKLEK